MWGQLQRRVSWMKQRIGRWQLAPAGAHTHHLAQYYLGRGRRAREAGRTEQGVRDARRAIALAPRNPWAYALLGQCLRRTAGRDASQLIEAAHALERARRLAPTNGYFVRLALEIAHAQQDARARQKILDRAWWAGAAVERWLPDGPPQPSSAAARAGQEGMLRHAVNQVDQASPPAPQAPQDTPLVAAHAGPEPALLQPAASKRADSPPTAAQAVLV